MRQAKLFFTLIRVPRFKLLLVVVIGLAAGCAEEPPAKPPKSLADAEAQQPTIVDEGEVPPSGQIDERPIESETPPIESAPPENSSDSSPKAAEAVPEVRPDETSQAQTDSRVERVAPIGVLQLSMQKMPGALALGMSPDGKAVAVGHDDGLIILYEVETWKELSRLSGSKFPVRSLSFSGDGKHLVSGGGDDDHGELKLWNLTEKDVTPESLPPHEYEYKISDVAISPDGTHVLSCCLGEVRSMSVTNHESFDFIYEKGRYQGGPMLFSPDGEFAVAANDQGVATVVQLEGFKEKTFRAASDRVGESLAIDADGRGFILADSRGNPFRAWDFQGNSRMKFDAFSGGVFSLALTPDGKYLIGGGSSSDAFIRIWERSTGRVVTEWNAHDDIIKSILLAHQGSLIVSTGWSWSQGKQTAITKVWSLAEALKLPRPTKAGDPSQLTELVKSPGVFTNDSGVCLSRDGLTVYSADKDEVHVQNFSLLNDYNSPTTLTKFLPNGIRYFDDYRETREPDEEDYLSHIELSSDGRTLLTADLRGRIRVWDTATRALKKTHHLHHKDIDTLLLAPDGKSFLSTDVGSRNMVCRHIESGEELWSTKVRENMDSGGRYHPRPICFSGDGKSVAIAEQESVRFLSARHGIQKNKFSTPVKYPELISLSARDGQVAVSGTTEEDEELLCLFADGKQVWQKKGKEKFLAICFSADGRYVFTSAKWKSSEIVDATDGKLVRVISNTSCDDFVVPASADHVVTVGGGTAALYNVSHLLDADLLAVITKIRKLNVEIIATGDEILLDFEDSPAADDDLAVLAELSVPFRLQLKDSANLTDAGLAHLSGQSNLVSIDLSGSEAFTDKGFANLQGLPDLREVIANRCEGITDRSMEVIGGFKKLERLDIQGTKITGKGLRHLGALTQLRELHLSLDGFEAVDFDSLAALKDLRVLDLGYLYGKLTAESLKFLTQLKKLERLNVAGCELDDDAMKSLAGLTSLKYLRVSGNEITDEGCASLSDLINLEELLIDGNAVTDAGLQHFGKLVNLLALDIGDTKIVGTGLEALAPLTKLRMIELDNMDGFTGQRLDVLADMPLLTHLDLSDTGVTDAGLRSIAGVKQLKTLHLPRSITDACFVSLKDLINLQNLYIDDEAEITGTGLVHLKNLLKLKDLYLSDLPITDTGLESVAQLHQLNSVSLSSTKITDQGLKHLLSLPELSSLELGNTAISDQGLAVLEKIKTVRTLGLEQTKTTKAGRKRLEESIDNLFIRE